MVEKHFHNLQSVDRLLDILEAISASGDVGVSECSKLTGVNKSTVYRMLATLERRGYARKDPQSERYEATARWQRLRSNDLAPTDLLERAHERLVALRDATHETVHLATYQGGGIARYVDRVESTQPVRSSSLIGTCVPSSCTSTGKLLLAYQSADEIDRVCTDLKSHTKRTIVGAGAMREELAMIRRFGFAVNRGEYRAEVCGVAVGIRDLHGAVIAAVGLCVPQFRFPKSAIARQVKQLRSTVALIEADFGRSPLRRANAAGDWA